MKLNMFISSEFTAIYGSLNIVQTKRLQDKQYVFSEVNHQVDVIYRVSSNLVSFFSHMAPTGIDIFNAFARVWLRGLQRGGQQTAFLLSWGLLRIFVYKDCRLFEEAVDSDGS